MVEKLKHVLRQEDTVLFVGSGISLWSGLPSWSGLIENLCEYLEHSGANSSLVKMEAERGDLLQAASYGFAKLTKAQIGSFIRDQCMYGIVKPHDIHKKIVMLGPRCFITTNYDNLIEESLRIWQPNRTQRPPVTNKQLTEIAEVVHARAVDFVFKPHGDAGDADSVILTREQYRQLLPGGERSAALDAVRLLLATRPVVYLGFGLRDPDFLYLRDLLSNTYKGAIRDHYAIMSDVQEDEISYWRESYGIHLVSYPTVLTADGRRSHDKLLDLLDQLIINHLDPITLKSVDLKNDPSTILALARHAARLASAKRKNPEFPVRVHSNIINSTKNPPTLRQLSFNYWKIEKFLDAGPNKAVLTGLPGAGKTYSIQRAAARLAEKLHRHYLGDERTDSAPTIPILIDLKLYTGNLFDLAAKTLPEHMALEKMLKEFNFKFFIDSFNEMPREHWENGSYQADFTKFIQRIGSNSLVIGSRTNDGLQAFELPTFDLAEISADYVEAEIKGSGYNLGGHFRKEIISLLQKPFYFNLIISGLIQLPPEPRPRDFYQLFFDQLFQDFETRFDCSAPLTKVLSLIAYNAINRGEEAQPLGNVTTILALEVDSILASDIVNWLVSKAVLIPYSGARIAFFHQSATEYLASLKLAELYLRDRRVIKDKLRLNRWDQAIFLTLSMLPSDASNDFLQAVLSTDFELAIRAAKYVEYEKDEIVAQLLDRLIDQSTLGINFASNIPSLVEAFLPVSEAHEIQLRMLMQLGESMGAAAATLLFGIRGEKLKEELMNEFARRPSDFNYCHNGIAPILSEIINESDVNTLHSLVLSLDDQVTEENYEDEFVGIISGVSLALSEMPCDIIKRVFIPDGMSEEIPTIIIKILLHYLWDNSSSESLALAAELLSHRIVEATVSIYFIGTQASRDDTPLDWTPFHTDHIDFLISLVGRKIDHSWPTRALLAILGGRPDLRSYTLRNIDKLEPVKKSILQYCCNGSDPDIIFSSLSWHLDCKNNECNELPITALSEIDISWHKHGELLVRLLQLKNNDLVVALLGHSFDMHDRIGNDLNLGDLYWWLEWMSEQNHSDRRLAHLLGNFLSMQVANNIQERFLAEFNRSNTKYREPLVTILKAQTNLSTDDLSEEAISYLLDHLEIRSEWEDCATLLGEAATERFVNERLLSLMTNPSPTVAMSLKDVLSRAGAKHGRRYIVG